MKIKKNGNLNFALEILIFTATVIAAYFFIDEFVYIACLSVVMCIYESIKIFRYIKDRFDLRIFSFIITILALVLILHIVVINGTENPVPVFMFFIITNLFFIYDMVLYIYNRYRKLNFLLLITMWILCDGIPVVMIFLLSAGLSV